MHNYLGEFMIKKRFIETVLSLGLSSLAMAQAASAQTAGGTATSESADQIQEIVVTAQKREENLQRVPISVEVVSAAAVSNAHTQNLEALTGAIPNVQVGHFANNTLGAVFSIRGIGTISTD